MTRIRSLISALWFGSAVFLMLSASAAFRAAGNPTVAADVVGSMLTRWHYIALAAPLVLFVFELRRVRPLLLILLFSSVILAATQSFVDLRIRAIRSSTPTGVSSLDPDHPVRKRFGVLHGLSMLLLLMQAIAAATAVASRNEPREEPAMAPSTSGPGSEDTTIYKAIVNDEEQYSIWPVDRETPLGWRDAGFSGLKPAVLAWIEEVWTDMRPLSLRKKMEEDEKKIAGGGP